MPRLALALFGASAVVAGLALLPAGQGAASTISGTASPSPTASPSGTPSASATPSKPSSPKRHRGHKHTTGTTVFGKRLWIPDPAKSAGGYTSKYRSSVTVSQTAHLTNQFVKVSWKNFTPSQPAGDGVYSQEQTVYPVMVAECNTANVKWWYQCYGATDFGVPAIGADGPTNTEYAATTAHGTGAVEVQVQVAEQNQMLGCGIHHRCSIVVVPAQGGYGTYPKVDCKYHQLDSDYATAIYDFGGQFDRCSWADRIVIPLSFVRAPKFCAVRNPDFTALGSPMLNLAMQQWIGALCTGSDPVTITYNPAITEPEAIQDLGTLGDVALTTRPGPTTQIGKHTYTYAPLSVSSVAIAYWVDSPKTYQPVTNLKFDPRLVAKLLTQSYDFENDGCPVGSRAPTSGFGCDGGVDGNPGSLFADPEFKKLNPTIQPPVGALQGFQVPTVMSGHSDMTWEVTSWIMANQGANEFMHGQPDPWGMHLNTAYLGVDWPQDSFTAQDNFIIIAHKYSPDFPLSVVVQTLAENSDNGTSYEIDTVTQNYDKDPPETPGARALFAIVDEGDAANLGFPVARILNHSGHYVAPSDKTMKIALSTMVPSGSNGITKQVDFAKERPDAYPLTMVIYAMVPTKGVSKKKADAIARFLDYVAGPGQHRGLNVGELPPGYLPLPAKLRAQTLHAAQLVLAQGGNSPSKKKKKSSSPSSSPSPNPSSSKNSGSSPSSSASPTSPSSSPHIVTIALKSAQTVGMVRYVLPALLIVGGLTALGGASSLIASTAGMAILAPLRRIRRLRLTLRRKK
jgi:hypothetical protein